MDDVNSVGSRFRYAHERAEQPVTNRVDTILGLSPFQIKSIMVIIIISLGALAFSHVELVNKYNVI